MKNFLYIIKQGLGKFCDFVKSIFSLQGRRINFVISENCPKTKSL